MKSMRVRGVVTATRFLSCLLVAALLLLAGCGREEYRGLDDLEPEGGHENDRPGAHEDNEPTSGAWPPHRPATDRESPLALSTGTTANAAAPTLAPGVEAERDTADDISLEEIRIRCAALVAQEGPSDEIEKLWHALRQLAAENEHQWRQQVYMMMELAATAKADPLLEETIELHAERAPEHGEQHPIAEVHDRLARSGQREISSAIRAAVLGATVVDPMLRAAMLEREVMTTPKQWSSEGLRLVDETVRRIQESEQQHHAIPALAVAERIRIQIYRQQLRLDEMIEAVDGYYKRFGAQSPSEAQRVADLMVAAVKTAERHKPDAEALQTRDTEELRRWAESVRSAMGDSDELENAVRRFHEWARVE